MRGEQGEAREVLCGVCGAVEVLRRVPGGSAFAGETHECRPPVSRETRRDDPRIDNERALERRAHWEG